MLHEFTIALGLVALVGVMIAMNMAVWRRAQLGHCTLLIRDRRPDLTTERLRELHDGIMGPLRSITERPVRYFSCEETGGGPVIAADGPLRFDDGITDPKCIVSCASALTASHAVDVDLISCRDLTISDAGRVVVRSIVSAGFAHIAGDEIVIDRLGAELKLYALAGHLRLTRVSSPDLFLSSRQNMSEDRPKSVTVRPSPQRVVHNSSLRIPSDTVISDDIICRADLIIGPRVTVGGNVKVYGSLTSSDDVVFKKTLIVNGRSYLEGRTVFEDATVLKQSVTAKKPIFLGTADAGPASLTVRSLICPGLFGAGRVVATSRYGITVQ